MSKHTPGPWVVDLSGPFTLGGDSVPVEAMTPGGMISREVCSLMVDSDDFPDGPEWLEDAANARLIAAAPDLLEALKELRKYADYMQSIMGEYWQQKEGYEAHHLATRNAEKKADAAIAKAEGENR